MAKAGAPKKAKAKPKLSDKEQSERFKETARKLGVDESGFAIPSFLNSAERRKTEMAHDTIGRAKAVAHFLAIADLRC
jgi:hypothetical protein